jgi:hypothetical protein
LITDIWIWNGTHCRCDRSAGDAHYSAAIDCRGSVLPYIRFRICLLDYNYVLYIFTSLFCIVIGYMGFVEKTLLDITTKVHKSKTKRARMQVHIGLHCICWGMYIIQNKPTFYSNTLFCHKIPNYSLNFAI